MGGFRRDDLALLNLFDQLPYLHRQEQLAAVLQELGCRPEAAGMGIPDRLSNDYLRARGPGVQRLPSSAEPGVRLRCVTAGELTYVQTDKTTVYRAGECFFESGDVSNTAANRTAQPVVLLNFEVLPAAWSDSSAIPVPR